MWILPAKCSEIHWARAFDWRGLELGKVISFENSAKGFQQFTRWASELDANERKNCVIVGAEPTRHYWFTLAVYLKNSGVKLVLVNPYHVKRSKELDDNHSSKSDRKDPKTIAKLMLEGRYIEPYLPEGLYAELRVVMNCRWRILRELTTAKKQIQRWLKIYFPEHGAIFRNFTCVGSLALLKVAPMPGDLAKLGPDGINTIWRQ